MMKQSLCISLLLVLFYSSCNNKRPLQTEHSVQIRIEQFADKKIELHEVMDKIEVIDLSVDSTLMLAHLKDITMVDSLLFLLDDISATIWTLNVNNKQIINRSCRRGNGPQEFIRPVAISAWNEHLYILDLPMHKVVVLNKDLSPLSDFTLPFNAFDLAATSSGLLFYNLTPNEEFHTFIQTDFSGKVIANLLQTEKEIGESTSGQKTLIKGSDGNVYAVLPEGNEVYVWKDETFVLAYSMDYRDKSIPENYNRKNQSLMEEDYYAINTNVFVLPELFVNSFLYGEKRYYVFTSFKQDKQISGIVRDKKTDLPFFPQWQAGNCLIGWCNGIDVNKFLSQKESASSISEDSDVLLLFYPKPL